MLLLLRPRSGRMLCGVAIGLAERYGLHVTLVRTVFITAFIAAPIAIFLYLLLSLSMPSEINVAGTLRLAPADATLPPGERFENLSELLSTRLLETRASPWVPSYLPGIWLLVFAVLLELPHMQSIIPYHARPIAALFTDDLSLMGTSLFYISVALLFLFHKERPASVPVFESPVQYRFSLDRRAGKMIGGVVSGLSKILELDPAYLRVVLIVINLLTFGLAGAVYLLVWFLYRQRTSIVVIDDAENVSQHHALRPLFRFGIALLFLLLAAIHSATAFRLFFFNEIFVQGLVMALVGMALVWHGIRSLQTRSPIGVVTGASLFFLGIYWCVTNVAHLQISTGKNIEIAEIILALSMVYLGTVVLRDYARSLAFAVASVFALSSLLIALGFIPPVYLMELTRFYRFFYPILFAGFGLWIAFEK